MVRVMVILRVRVKVDVIRLQLGFELGLWLGLWFSSHIGSG